MQRGMGGHRHRTPSQFQFSFTVTGASLSFCMYCVPDRNIFRSIVPITRMYSFPGVLWQRSSRVPTLNNVAIHLANVAPIATKDYEWCPTSGRVPLELLENVFAPLSPTS